MNSEIQKEMLDRLDLLSSKLGVVAEGLWSVLVRQAQIEVSMGFVQLGLYALMAYLFVRYFKLVLHKTTKENWDDIAWLPVIFAGLFVFFCVFVGGYCALESIVYGIGNPEYVAMQKLGEVLSR